jgi:hypothetical protein
LFWFSFKFICDGERQIVNVFFFLLTTEVLLILLFFFPFWDYVYIFTYGTLVRTTKVTIYYMLYLLIFEYDSMFEIHKI